VFIVYRMVAVGRVRVEGKQTLTKARLVLKGSMRIDPLPRVKGFLVWGVWGAQMKGSIDSLCGLIMDHSSLTGVCYVG